MVRLNKFLAECGVASRRKADELIFEGHVKVNGKIITEMGFKVDPYRDFIKVNNKRIENEKKIYIVMNKPDGCVCSVSDEKDRATVIDLLKPAIKQRIYPVGRLDYNTTGCLILTNDGDWANKIIHPKYEIPKVYRAKIKGRMTSRSIERLISGVKVEDKYVRAKSARVFKHGDENDTVEIVVTKGMNHQVKNMMLAVGAPVIRLTRESVGRVTSRGLIAGQWRYLTESEIKSFSSAEVKKRAAKSVRLKAGKTDQESSNKIKQVQTDRKEKKGSGKEYFKKGKIKKSEEKITYSKGTPTSVAGKAYYSKDKPLKTKSRAVKGKRSTAGGEGTKFRDKAKKTVKFNGKTKRR